MGLQDREYYSDLTDDESWRGPKAKKPLAITTILIAICVTVSIADLLTTRDAAAVKGVTAETVFGLRAALAEVHPVYGNLALSTFVEELPARAYTFLTYGFTHKSLSDGSRGVLHLAGNCLALYFLGRLLEDLLGRMEYLRYYLAAVIFSGVFYFGVGVIARQYHFTAGASGAVTACVICLAWKIPQQRLMLFGALEAPMWGIGVGYVALDILGAMGHGDPVIAYTGHLGGALFATLYHQLGLNFEFLDFSRWGLWRRQAATRRNLKVHTDETSEIEDLAEEADRLLAKIQDKGVSSLSKRERDLLERYSRDVSSKRKRRD